MKSQNLQKLVKKIYSNEETKARFVSDPEGLLSHYKLTESEKKAMLQTHYKFGLITAGSSQLETTVGPTTWWASPTP